MKPLISLLLTFCLLATALPFAVAESTPHSDFSFSYVNGNAHVSNYIGNDTHVVIPATDVLGHATVTEVNTFNNSNVVSVVIPEGVIRLGSQGFSYCSNLVWVTLPQTLTTIADRAFYKCTSLTSVTIPAAVTKIGDDPMKPYVFYGCSSLTAINVDENNANYCSVDGVLLTKNHNQLIQYPIGNQSSAYTIPDDVTNIWIYSFHGSKNLTSVTIPDSVKDIWNYAFADCSNLTSVTIGKNVANIWPHAFDGCTSLTNVYYTGTREEWEAITIYDSNTPLTKATVHFAGEPEIPDIPDEPDVPDVPDVPETPSDISPADIPYGDVSDDGIINAKDALDVLKFVVGKKEFTKSQQKAADVNGDKKTDAKDALEILKFTVGKIEIFPVQR